MYSIPEEVSVDMTREQLDTMWRHFRVLDSDRSSFVKPPSTWRPRAVRDMTADELNAYWGGFREIMQSAAQRAPDVPICLNPSDASQNPPESQQPIASLPESKQPIMSLKPTKRVRGKTSPALLAVKNDGSKKGSSEKRLVARKPPGPKKTRKYNMKAKVARNGKSSSVSIWTKVQLFKEPRFRFGM